MHSRSGHIFTVGLCWKTKDTLRLHSARVHLVWECTSLVWFPGFCPVSPVGECLSGYGAFTAPWPSTPDDRCIQKGTLRGPKLGEGEVTLHTLSVWTLDYKRVDGRDIQVSKRVRCHQIRWWCSKEFIRTQSKRHRCEEVFKVVSTGIYVRSIAQLKFVFSPLVGLWGCNEKMVLLTLLFAC